MQKPKKKKKLQNKNILTVDLKRQLKKGQKKKTFFWVINHIPLVTRPTS